jgi:hypothetical protein
MTSTPGTPSLAGDVGKSPQLQMADHAALIHRHEEHAGVQVVFAVAVVIEFFDGLLGVIPGRVRADGRLAPPSVLFGNVNQRSGSDLLQAVLEFLVIFAGLFLRRPCA